MEQYITPDRIANAIMLDSSFTGNYLIVEGKKDHNLYGKFIDRNLIRIRTAFGCYKVKKVLDILDSRGYVQKLGIIDRDFRSIMNTPLNTDGLFITDDHDIEIMIIKTQALEYVLEICCTKISINKFEKSSNQTIRDSIFSLGKEIGFLKLANKMYNLGLVFKPKNPEGNQIKYKDFISDKTLDFKGHKKLIESIINYSRSKVDAMKTQPEIEKAFHDIQKQSFNIHQLVNGHDLSNILFLLMKKVLKSKSKLLVDFNTIEDSLVLAYEYSSFQSTDLYNDIVSWANKKSIKVFK